MSLLHPSNPGGPTPDAALRTDSLKSEYVSRMSHELLTPLAVILGFSQLLEASDLDEKRAGHVDHVIKAGNHLLDLIDELLDVSRLQVGTMTVEGALGAGTTFAVELEQAEAPWGAREAQGAPKAYGKQTQIPRCTILCVEGNAAHLRLIEQALDSQSDVTLLTATSGLQGIALACERSPDLVLLDVHLPDIDGDLVIEHLRGDPRSASIPIVVLSADATARQEGRMRSRGVTDHLMKPLDIPRLLEVIAEALTTNSSSDLPGTTT